MYCHINAGGLRGLESYAALVEVDVSRGLPCFEMVGLLAGEVKEARERIRVALKNAGADVPAGTGICRGFPDPCWTGSTCPGSSARPDFPA